MRNKTILILLLLCLGSKAQETDTIFVNEHFNVALFFPEKIRQGVVGAENFIFSYNQEHSQYFGLLKGGVGKPSNLLAITKGGKIFSFLLAYREKLPKLTYFLTPKDALGNEQPLPDAEVDAPPGVDARQKQDQVEVHLKKLGKRASFYGNYSAGKIKSQKKKGLLLQVIKMIYHENEVFLVFEIKNNSSVAFQPDYLRLFLTSGSRKRNASLQKLLMKPVITRNFPESVPPGEHKRFVYVFPKFTLGDQQKLEVELREKQGNRLLKIDFRPKLD